MNSSIPGYLAPYVLTGSITAVAILLFGLRRALGRAAWPQADRAKAFWSVAALLAGWFIVALTTSLAGSYQGIGGKIPTIQFGIVIPILAGMLLFWTWPLLRRTLAAVPKVWIVRLQFYRALGVIFVILYAAGRLPGLFAWPAGVGDTLVGLLAPFAASTYLRSPQDGAGRLRLWNLLGITDLVVAVTTGFLTSPSPLQMAAFDHPNTLISMYPLVLIPVYMVPLSILLHLASLYQLRDAARIQTKVGLSKAGVVGTL